MIVNFPFPYQIKYGQAAMTLIFDLDRGDTTPEM
jgi:hypothetical protein